METVGVEPTSASLQARCSVRLSYIPQCGRVESNHHSPRRQGYSLLSSPVLSVRVRRWKGGRPGSNRRRRGSQPRGASVYTTTTTSGDDRTRTGGLSPDKRALCSSELRPRK